MTRDDHNESETASTGARAAVVLLSGGLDSAVTSLAAKRLGYRLHGLTFAYGQRHGLEIDFATRLAKRLGFEAHRVLRLEGVSSPSSALTGDVLEVPKDRSDEELDAGIPVTYVPARNTIFLSYALAYCEQGGLGDIFLGVNSLDYSGYPDCRPEFLHAFERLANLATKAGVERAGGLEPAFRLHAPLLHRTKADIIRLGSELGLDFTETWSCYDPVAVSADDETGTRADFVACGACDSCLLRKRGFLEAGLPDPTSYAPGSSAGH